ncbi:hypothetical protein B0H19DRAFT_1255785 [Mycena capillaripes]|nr:hypothetical protein B0H19DRAFT_1255785 [Mycena capillaripes]
MAVPLGGTGLNYASSAFLAIFLETLFYGLFVFTFMVSTFVLYRKRARGQTALANINIPLLSVSSAMFIFGTMHLGIDAYRSMEAFVYYPGGAFAYLLATGTNTPLYVLKNVLYTAQTILGDGFIIYRLYKVWGGNRLISLPFVLCFFASIATGVGTLVTQTLRKPSQSLFSGALHDWPLASSIMTLVINVGCTALIAYRIWTVNRETKMLDVGRLTPVAVVIVESGLVYAVSVVVFLGLYMSNSGAYKILQDALMQIIGLVFCGIIASVGFRWSDSTRHAMNPSTKASALVFGTRSARLEADSDSYALDSTIERTDAEKGHT